MDKELLLQSATRFSFGKFNPKTGETPIHVEKRSEDKKGWAIVDGGFNYCHIKKDWEWEPSNSSKDKAFFERCRYDLEEAITIALILASEQKERESNNGRR